MKIALVYPRGNKLSSKFRNILDTRPKTTLIPLGMLYMVANSGLDVDSHNGIIIPKTHKASKQVVDLAHYVIQKWFAVKEKYL